MSPYQCQPSPLLIYLNKKEETIFLCFGMVLLKKIADPYKGCGNRENIHY